VVKLPLVVHLDRIHIIADLYFQPQGCISLALDDLSMVFSGDALLIRGCGRTDFQGGSALRLHESIHRELYGRLPDHCKVMPAHDYQGRLHSTIGEEKALNPRLTRPVDEFVSLMNSLNLPRPNLMDTAVPANLFCGLQSMLPDDEVS